VAPGCTGQYAALYPNVFKALTHSDGSLKLPLTGPPSLMGLPSLFFAEDFIAEGIKVKPVAATAEVLINWRLFKFFSMVLWLCKN
jgi:hypothetical protein